MFSGITVFAALKVYKLSNPHAQLVKQVKQKETELRRTCIETYIPGIVH